MIISEEILLIIQGLREINLKLREMKFEIKSLENFKGKLENVLEPKSRQPRKKKEKKEKKEQTE